MSNARITYNFDAWLAATITQSSEVAGRLADNVLTSTPGKSWATTGDSSEWIVFDLGSATAITTFFINQHNFTSAATVTLEAHTSDSWGAPSYSQVLTVATDADGEVLPCVCFYLSETYRYWRLTIADAANPDGRIEIGNIYAGSYYTFTRNFSDGGRIVWRDPSSIKDSDGSVDLIRELGSGKRYRQALLSFTQVSDTERKKWEAIFRRIGNHAPAILSLDPDDALELSLFGFLKSDVGLVWQTLDYFDVVSVTFEEKTR